MSPFPLLLRGFLTSEEVHDVRIPSRGWCRSVVLDDVGHAKHDPMRTSEQQQLRPQHEALRRIRRRVCELNALPQGLRFNGEASLVRYRSGQGYGAHGDAAGLRRGREWTVLVCLRAADEGGETYFPKRSFKIKLGEGDALVWPNYANGMENEDMDHEALPVTKGCKVVANVWFDAA